VFILGGPGSGKGTQSELLRDRHNFVHLSAGDLLRTERKNKDSQDGALIEKCIVEGKIVPSQITVKLLGNAMTKEKERNRFLIDGFPRNQENLQNWL
jgi:UMP-CMP kinase